MVEWFKAAVLKTAVAQATLGSNPALSAIFFALISRQKKHEAWKGFASYRICGASYFAAMPQNASYAERHASPNPDQPFQTWHGVARRAKTAEALFPSSFHYAAASHFIPLWSIRFAHMM